MLEDTVTDLRQSGLVPEDMQIRELDTAERTATLTPHSTEGYVIPYYDMHGRLQPFYRVYQLVNKTYKQPQNTPNHLYFSKQFESSLGDYVLFVETEKEAVLATKLGHASVALGGFSAWHNRTLIISPDASLAQSNSQLAIKLPSKSTNTIAMDFNPEYDNESFLSVGLCELIDLIVSKNLKVIICFPSDPFTGFPYSETQRAAAVFAYELRFRGVPFFNIKQLILPRISTTLDGSKTPITLNSIATRWDTPILTQLITGALETKRAFPLHPNVREYISRRLEKPSITRKEMQSISLAIISDLDSKGMRLRSIDGNCFYFDKRQHKLVQATWGRGPQEQYDSPFMQYLYQIYGLSGADQRTNVWVGTQFTGEEPIEDVTPQRVFARLSQQDDAIYYQISDTEFAKLTANDLRIHQNGDLNILFASEQVAPLNTAILLQEFQRQLDQPIVPCWWATTLSKVRMKDKDKQRILTALLYYVSPWLHRWRGMQLPIEMIIGESGSGKSSLCELRLEIITGKPFLRNAPNDIKDWHASITNAGGLHITDNVQLLDKSLRQKLSDEVCRLITENDPYIEQRKYYTNAEQIRIPVKTVFALTSINQPFQNADLLQRALILELDKSIDQDPNGIIRYDSNWKNRQLNMIKNGREGWVAHHLVVLQRFFQIAKQNWNQNYSAKHRLANFEQTLLLIAKVFELDVNWLPAFMFNLGEQAISEADWAIEGLHSFADLWFLNNKLNNRADAQVSTKFVATDITDWCKEHIEYRNCDVLNNPRRLGRYMKAHKSAIFSLVGIEEAGLYNNRAAFRIHKRTRKEP